MTEPRPQEILARAAAILDAGGHAVLCQIVRSQGSTPGKPGWRLLVSAEGAVGNLGGGAFEALVQRDAEALLGQPAAASETKRYYLTEEAVHGEATGMVCGGFSEVFLEILKAPPVVAACGGGPVGQAVAKVAALAGFDLLVIDDRSEFLAPELFPEGTRLTAVGRGFEEDFLAGLGQRELFVAVVTRCWETDLAALSSVLRQAPSALRYLGLLGSQRKVERVVAELREREQDVADLPFFGPIGLRLGGDSPGEIAVSIVAQMLETRYGAQARGSAAMAAPRRRC